MKLAQEFKEFISRGNVVDLAVGVIIGGAFGNIVNSLVKDVVMPPIGYLTSGIDFSSLTYKIPHSEILGPNPKDHSATPDIIQLRPPVEIHYGNFLNTLITFLIIASVIFVVVKGVNVLKRLEAAKPTDPPTPSGEEKLLIEIRDLLAKKQV